MEPTSKFIVVKCECGNEQKTFNKAASTVKCQKCGAVLVESSGGKSVLKAKFVKELK